MTGVAGAPTLRADISIIQQVYRGETSFVVKDLAAQKYFRFGTAEVRVLRAFDGTRTCAEIAVSLAEEGLRISAQAVESFARTMAEAGFLERGLEERTTLQIERLRAERRERRRRSLFRGELLRMRWSFGDPDALLTRTLPYVDWMFGRTFAIASVAAFLVYLALLVARWDEFSAALASTYSLHQITLTNVIVLWVTGALVILIHELGHGYACKHYGGEVHELGFMLVYFQPAFYCNVSDAWSFPDRRAGHAHRQHRGGDDARGRRVDTAHQRQPAPSTRRLLRPHRLDGDSEPAPARLSALPLVDAAAPAAARCTRATRFGARAPRVPDLRCARHALHDGSAVPRGLSRRGLVAPRVRDWWRDRDECDARVSPSREDRGVGARDRARRTRPPRCAARDAPAGPHRGSPRRVVPALRSVDAHEPGRVRGGSGRSAHRRSVRQRRRRAGARPRGNARGRREPAAATGESLRRACHPVSHGSGGLSGARRIGGAVRRPQRRGEPPGRGAQRGPSPARGARAPSGVACPARQLARRGRDAPGRGARRSPRGHGGHAALTVGERFRRAAHRARRRRRYPGAARPSGARRLLRRPRSAVDGAGRRGVERRHVQRSDVGRRAGRRGGSSRPTRDGRSLASRRSRRGECRARTLQRARRAVVERASAHPGRSAALRSWTDEVKARVTRLRTFPQ